VNELEGARRYGERQFQRAERWRERAEQMHGECQALAAEIVLYRRLVSEHHSVGYSAPKGALVGDQCPVCAAFQKRAEEDVVKLVIEG